MNEKVYYEEKLTDEKGAKLKLSSKGGAKGQKVSCHLQKLLFR